MSDERGSVSLLVVLVLPALLMAGGLVLDGGRQLQARRDANAAATAASRAATQLSVDEVYARRLDVASARQRAQAELARQGATGVVSVAGQSVTVTVRATVDYALLPGGGTVTESSTSDPSEGCAHGERHAVRWRGILGAVAAFAAMLALVVAVPVLLVLLVGNPWPGRTRVELGDEVAIVIGLLAVAGWVLWGRFLVAVVMELRLQVAELRRAADFDPRIEPVAPPASRTGVGLLAQRLVAAALVLLPLAGRAPTSVADALPTPAAERSVDALPFASGGVAGAGRRRGRQHGDRARGRHPDRAGPQPPRRPRAVAGDLRAQP